MYRRSLLNFSASCSTGMPSSLLTRSTAACRLLRCVASATTVSTGMLCARTSLFASRIVPRSAEKHVYKQIIYAERGTILDANSEVLAHNIPVETVVADATHLNNRQAVVDLVSSELKLPPPQVAEKLGSDRRYIVIKREVPEAQAGALREKLRAADLR